MTISIDAAEGLTSSSHLTPEQIQQALPKLREQIVNKSNQFPLHQRFRAIFTLKSIGTAEAVDILSEGFKDPSALLKHELAYVLGQTKNPLAIPILISVLSDVDQDPMVRHEAGEALGAIGDLAALPALRSFLSDSEAVVRETCELAVNRIEMEATNGASAMQTVHKNEIVFESVDPAPPLKQQLSVPELTEMLMNSSLTLFERYRAMFSLRNRASKEAVLGLCEGFGDKSALFKHEIAYVLGQLQHPASVPALSKVLSDPSEAGIVRHECAEALGSIATPECFEILSKFKDDSEIVVRESCIVALDIFDYENSNEFQYANGISKGESN